MDANPPIYPPASFAPSPSGSPPPVVRRKPLSFWLALLFAAVSAVAFLVIIVLSVGLGTAGLGAARSDGFQEKEVEGSGRDKIVWVPVHGILLHADGGPFSSLDVVDRTLRTLEQAGEDDQVKAVVLDVDSPGGGITESDQIYHAVQKLTKERGKKVVVLMGNVAASGGYYISAPADRILAHPTTITGSIGVISQFFNVEELFGKVGLRTEVIKSGRFKDIGSAMRPMTEADRRIFQHIVDVMYDRFVERVLAGRGAVTLADKSPFNEPHLRRIADGRIYTADEAQANGLVDAIGYREDALAEARRLAGLTQARVVEYVRRPNLFDLLSARGAAAGPSVTLDVGSLIRAMSPRLLYLWTAP